MVNGFLLALDPTVLHQIYMLNVAGGWIRVLECFLSDHITEMERCAERFMILLIDFDGQKERLVSAKARIPGHLMERVFVLGAWSEPEALRRADLGSYETIGRAMAKDCREGTDTTWGHDLLRHNASEIERLRERVHPILFRAS
jgi:hypothetical protein